MHTISMEDIKGYLATKGDDEVIGHCMDCYSCLAHNTLTWKYELKDEDVEALSTFAFVLGSGLVDFPEDVQQAVHTFDTLKGSNSPVTKAEFIAAHEW